MTQTLKDFLELTKPRLVSLVLLSTAVGFYLASCGAVDGTVLLRTLLGTALVAGGSMALNEWMERDEDARMKRTSSRPIPSGRIRPAFALVFGILISLAGFASLWIIQPISALVASLIWVSYLLIYTPLKKRTSLCTLAGAIPGALPPLIGWTAASGGRPDLQAWILFLIIFLWQMPHFFAIAWLHRADYTAAGFRMLSVEDPGGNRVARQILLYSFATVQASFLASAAGLTGPVYFWGALVAGFLVLALAVTGLERLNEKARSLFRASVLYLAFLFLLMVVDKA